MEALGHVKSFRAHAPKTRQGACGNLDRYIATEEIGRKGEEEEKKGGRLVGRDQSWSARIHGQLNCR